MLHALGDDAAHPAAARAEHGRGNPVAVLDAREAVLVHAPQEEDAGAAGRAGGAGEDERRLGEEGVA